MANLTASRVLAPVGTAGKLFAFGLDVGRGIFRRPFQFREFVQQAWFVASVTIVPTMLVTIPFGAVIALELGTPYAESSQTAIGERHRALSGTDVEEVSDADAFRTIRNMVVAALVHTELEVEGLAWYLVSN